MLNTLFLCQVNIVLANSVLHIIYNVFFTFLRLLYADSVVFEKSTTSISMLKSFRISNA